MHDKNFAFIFRAMYITCVFLLQVTLVTSADIFCLDPDLDRQNVRSSDGIPDLLSEMLILEEKNQQKMQNYSVGKDLKYYTTLTKFSTKYLVLCKVYTDVGGIR